MPKFSKTSLARLGSCHPDLIFLFNTVIEHYDCSILCGRRGEKEQNEAFAAGLSKLRYPESRHNTEPRSLAVDAAPWPIPERWGDVPDRRVVARFYHFAGYVKATAHSLGIGIRWGGDWDGDNVFTDQTFDDLVHFELTEG